MAANITLDEVVNLQGASVLLVEHSNAGLLILSRIFTGFGVTAPEKCLSAAEAVQALGRKRFDLIVVEAKLPDMDGYEFVRMLRQSKLEPNCFAPVLMVAGHTKKSRVTAARDCGANFIVAKPLTPRTMLERVVWVSRECRPFVETKRYVGPDRRFKAKPADAPARREDDAAEGDPMEAFARVLNVLQAGVEPAS